MTKEQRLRKILLLTAFVILPVAIVWAGRPRRQPALTGRGDALFAMNLATVRAITWLLVRAFSGGREGMLSAARVIVRRYLAPAAAAKSPR